MHKEISILSLKVEDFDNFDENTLFEMPFKRKINFSNIRNSKTGKSYFLVKTDDFQEFSIRAEKLTEKIQFIIKKADGFVTDGYNMLKYVTFENLKPVTYQEKVENHAEWKKILVRIPLWLADENKLYFGEKIEKCRYINFKLIGESKKGIYVYCEELDEKLWLPKSVIRYEIQK